MAFKYKSALLFCLLVLTVRGSAQQNGKTPELPNTEEIKLAVAQSERAFEQYNMMVTMEAELPTAKRDTSAVEKDREVYRMGMKLIAALKVHPEGFNGLGGLLLLSSLDDASRNAALCSGTAYSDTMDAVMNKSDISSAKDWIHVGMSCIDTSGLLYTVSESVQALLVRETEAQGLLNQSAVETMNKCVAALKQCSSRNK
jgi:hypothetical protein